ncbi:insecticidal delta-endotoxin Cry8Ea1 family protein [Bacillus cereus]|uniref:insecticidal delta-endotoxin Cry8Ea1 family protein n=1 Tax=Bacillus cereus TaxID=1396 RepID=UPI0015968BC9|nr:insecticidal delta-endotoxin Cry8Ea1 family protein [Bacillus cereus]
MFSSAIDNTSVLLDLIEKGINDGDDLLGLFSFIGLTALEAIPIVGGTLSKLISIIFFSSKSSINPQKIWEELGKAINQIIDKKIEETLISGLIQEISGFANVLEEYRAAYDLYNGKSVFETPDNLTPGEYLVNVFTTANLLFIQRIPKFQDPDHDVLFLPFFVHIAEMHILLIRDAAMHGLEWGMDEKIHQKFKKDFKSYIGEYSAYLLKIYKKGLKEASERELNDKDFPTIKDKNHYINTVRWNVINQYKRGMTLTAFDFAYKWKYYHEVYQNNITLNPFRTIYSDIAGSVYPYIKTTNEINNTIKNQNLKYRGIFKKLQVYHAERIDSIQSTYIRNNEIINSTKIGGVGGRISSLVLEEPIKNPLIQVNMWSELVPISLGFKFYDEKEQNIGGGSWWPKPHKFGAYHFVGNKVSSIIGFGKNETGGFNSLDAMIVGFKRDDYTPENRLLGINETGEPVTKVIDAGNFQQEKFGSNIQITDEPMFGDGVLQFTNYANTMNQDSSVTYQINIEIEGIYQLHAIIGAKKQKDKLSFKVILNTKQQKKIITDSFDSHDIWEGMSLNESIVYKRILIGTFPLKRGMNSITIHNDVLQSSANIKTWNLGSLELTMDSDSIKDPDITTLYDKDNYAGTKKYIFEDTARLSDFNDRTSSIKVGSHIAGVRFYEHYHYSGDFIDLGNGEKLSLKNHRLNKRLSSVKFANLGLYKEDNYKGEKKLIFEDIPYLTDFNDKTSSIVVSPNVPGTVRLFEHSYYNGDYIEVSGGQKLSLKGHNLNRKISSIKFLKEHQVFNGLYEIVTAINKKSVVDWSQDKNSNVHLWEQRDRDNQKWYFDYDSSKQAFQIKSKADKNKVLAWNDFGGSKNVFATPNLKKDEHFWTFDYLGEGNYLIRNKKDQNLVLDVDGHQTANGTNIKVNAQHALDNPSIEAQKFKLNHVIN